MIYVDSNSTSPYFNFALEEYLLTQKDLGDDEIFLFWRTSPTVMVGRYQNTLAEINEPYVKKNNVNLVRRNSGGGTIYTDMGAWQFTFIQKNYKNEGIFFSKFTTPVVEALRAEGVDASFSGRNDLMIGNRKFSGNAQYIKDNAMLHHGSMLFDTDIKSMVEALSVSEEKIIAKGIKSVSQRVINVREAMGEGVTSEDFRDIMLKSLLKGSNKIYKLTDEDIKAIEKISKEKFESWEWTYGRNPKFNLERAKRFKGGRVSFKLEVKNGIIEDCQIEGDFFGSGDIEDVEKSLIGCKYRKEDLKQVLDSLNVKSYFYKITADDLLECLID